MKNICIVVGIVICAAVLSIPVPVMAVDIKEGKWEHTMEMKMEMEGLPMELPAMPFTTTQCMTQKDAVPSTAKENQSCEILNQKVSGNKVVWEVKCIEKDSVSEGEGDVTYSGSTYAGVIKMKGRRIGDCE